MKIKINKLNIKEIDVIISKILSQYQLELNDIEITFNMVHDNTVFDAYNKSSLNEAFIDLTTEFNTKLDELLKNAIILNNNKYRTLIDIIEFSKGIKDLYCKSVIEEHIRTLFIEGNANDILYSTNYNNRLNIGRTPKKKTLVALVKRASHFYSLNYRKGINLKSQEIAFKNSLLKDNCKIVVFTYVDDFIKIKNILNEKFVKSSSGYYIINNEDDLDEIINFIIK